MPKTPIWSTPERQSQLVELWNIYGNKCLFGHNTCPDVKHYIFNKVENEVIGKPVYIPCYNSSGTLKVDKSGKPLLLLLYRPVTVKVLKPEFLRLYDVITEAVIEDWKIEDREAKKQADRIEQIAMHSLAESRFPIRGHFNGISRDIYASSQPLYEQTGYGISGVTLKPFVAIRFHSSYVSLQIDISDNLKSISKNRQRKCIRYGKPLPQIIQDTIQQKIAKAVRHYFSN